MWDLIDIFNLILKYILKLFRYRFFIFTISALKKCVAFLVYAQSATFAGKSQYCTSGLKTRPSAQYSGVAWPEVQQHSSIFIYSTVQKIRFYIPEIKLRRLVLNFYIHVLWAIYIFPGLVCLFGCSKRCRPILGIYKSLTDTWMWKLGERTF